MDANVDLFWSFRSPYSYLALPGALRLERDFRAKLRFRPVLPLAVRDPSFFSPDNLTRAKYIGLAFAYEVSLRWRLGKHSLERS